MKSSKGYEKYVPLGIIAAAVIYYASFGGPPPCSEIESGDTITLLVTVTQAQVRAQKIPVGVPVGVNNQWVPRDLGAAAATVDPTDMHKIASLEENGVLMLVETGTEAKVLNRAGRGLVIRLLEGKYELKTGFVLIDYVDCRHK